MPRELLRDRLLVRLCNFECIYISLEELKRKLNLPWQLPLLLGLLILRRVECRSERLCCAKDEKIIVVRTASSLAIHYDETYEVKTQPGNNSL